MSDDRRANLLAEEIAKNQPRMTWRFLSLVGRNAERPVPCVVRMPDWSIRTILKGAGR